MQTSKIPKQYIALLITIFHFDMTIKNLDAASIDAQFVLKLLQGDSFCLRIDK